MQACVSELAFNLTQKGCSTKRQRNGKLKLESFIYSVFLVMDLRKKAHAKLDK
jgi:hypothetical protein